jgi:hypothetical protein
MGCMSLLVRHRYCVTSTYRCHDVFLIDCGEKVEIESIDCGGDTQRDKAVPF